MGTGKLTKKPFAKGVRWKNGAWRYRVPRWLDATTRHRLFDGKAEYTLGYTIADAAQRYSEIMQELDSETSNISIMSELMDRYISEVAPLKAPATRRNNLISLKRLRAVFGHMPPSEIESHQIFKYRDLRRETPTSANRDLEVLSHLFSKAIEWGVLRNNQHPMRGLRIKNPGRVRKRYVTDEELHAALSYASNFLQAYVGLKMTLGARKADMLRLELRTKTNEGIKVQPAKTADSSGKVTVYKLTPEREAAWAAALAARPQRVSSTNYLFCTRKGDPYIDEEGNTSGFDSIFRRWIDKALKMGAIQERFTENDLRAKVASDSEDMEQARRRLSHTSASTTRRHYHRKPEEAD
ncbi:tyrosine-type recombinase/integrase [Microbulbifer sp. 2201CG32-9]|uniref:tyrosine-type recombinase/integrase n=1 Tax=unclassified Microbulbifer TaxID=2619833 RepID=UPI00345B9531